MSEAKDEVIAVVRALLNDLRLRALEDRVRINAVLQLLDGMNAEPAPVNKDDDVTATAPSLPKFMRPPLD
jgi:hypothetical protein